MRSLKARCIVSGSAKGGILFSSSPIAFLQGVDADRGYVSDPKHEIFEKSFSKKILVFPNSVGSSVGAYVIYRLKKNGVAPKAMINRSSDIITASGCAIAGIPLYDVSDTAFEELKEMGRIFLDERKLEVRET